jgi:hypothetical protein
MPAQLIILGPPISPAAGLSPGQPAPPGVGLAVSRTLASAAQNDGLGTALLAADLSLSAPTSTPGGTYIAVLTLTVI